MSLLNIIIFIIIFIPIYKIIDRLSYGYFSRIKIITKGKTFYCNSYEDKEDYLEINYKGSKIKINKSNILAIVEK